MNGKVNNALYDNGNYDSGAGLTKRVCWFFVNYFVFQSAMAWPSRFKVALLRLFGCKVGMGVVIKPSINIKYPWYLSIGSYTWLGEEVWIDNLCQVTIGASVCLSQGAMLLTGNHNYKKSSFDLMVGSINLEDGSWVGARSVICPAVTIATHSVISVGSVVTSDTVPYGIYQGNPARLIKERVIT